MLSYKLPFDDSSGRTHRLVDNSASDGDSISLAIAALACGLCGKGVIFNVASDVLQLSARFGDAEGSIYLTRPDRFLIPITLSSELADWGTETYDDMVLQPAKNGREFGRTMQQDGSDLKALNVVTATKSSVSSDVHVSASAQRALQHKWVGGIRPFLLVIAERKHRTVHLTFLNSLPEYEPNEDRIRKVARNIVRHSEWMGNQ